MHWSARIVSLVVSEPDPHTRKRRRARVQRSGSKTMFLAEVVSIAVTVLFLGAIKAKSSE